MSRQAKKKKSGGVVRWLLNIGILVCIGVLAFALYNLWAIRTEYGKAEKEYEGIAAEFEEVLDREELAEDPAAFGENEDIRALLEKYAGLNEDFVGIIYIPGTNIFYPVMQGEDDDYYLHHTFDGTYNSSGSIFLTHSAAPDFSFPNTIIYGHNMHNGTMFENLNLLLNPDTLAAYNKVYILTLEEVRIYEIFWTGEISVESERYTTWFEDEQAIVDYFDFAAPGLGLGAEDTILTLSTCTYVVDSENRIVAQAALADVVMFEGFTGDAVFESELEESMEGSTEGT